MHGDHVFGLPGLLLNILTQTILSGQEKTLEIYGPVGLFNFIAATLSLCAVEVRKLLTVEVYEMLGGSNRWRHPGGNRRYPEFRHASLIRKVVPQNPDGTWTLCKAVEFTGPDEVLRTVKDLSLTIKAAEVVHVPKIHCFGYVAEESQTLPQSIDSERARNLGLKPSPLYNKLKFGFSVMNDDGTRLIRPEDVLVGDPVRPRKFALLGDCCSVPRPMAELCRNSDVLIHEATFSEHDTGKKVDFGGHSSAADAGRFANLVKAQVLALNHLSASVNGCGPARDLEEEAKKEIESGNPVIAATDLLEISVPRSGFRFSEESKRNSEVGEKAEPSREESA